MSNVLAAKSGALNSIPRTHTAEGQNQFSQVFLELPHDCHSTSYLYTFIKRKKSHLKMTNCFCLDTCMWRWLRFLYPRHLRKVRAPYLASNSSRDEGRNMSAGRLGLQTVVIIVSVFSIHGMEFLRFNKEYINR